MYKGKISCWGYQHEERQPKLYLLEGSRSSVEQSDLILKFVLLTRGLDQMSPRCLKQ